MSNIDDVLNEMNKRFNKHETDMKEMKESIRPISEMKETLDKVLELVEATGQNHVVADIRFGKLESRVTKLENQIGI